MTTHKTKEELALENAILRYEQTAQGQAGNTDRYLLGLKYALNIIQNL